MDELWLLRLTATILANLRLHLFLYYTFGVEKTEMFFTLLFLSKIIFVDTGTPLGVTCLYSCYREVFQGFHLGLNHIEAG